MTARTGSGDVNLPKIFISPLNSSGFTVSCTRPASVTGVPSVSGPNLMVHGKQDAGASR